MTGPTPTLAGVPAESARQVVEEAERAEAARPFGHDRDGHLSRRHGFLPAAAPLPALPPSHRAWDELAADLPALCRRKAVTRAVAALAVLDASADALDGAFLCRAALVLGTLAHAAARTSSSAAPGPAPEPLERPWRQVCDRLGRPGPALTFTDLLAYNWRLVGPGGARLVENLDVLVPAFGSEDERVFYMTFVETLGRAGGLIAGAVDAQEAALAGRADRLHAALAGLHEAVDALTFDSFAKTDPNRWSATHVDPVVWAKTVGPFAAPTREGEPGISGASSPVFHVLDALLGRRDFGTQLGKDTLHFRGWLPAGYQRLFEAIGRVPLRDAVVAADDRELAGVYQSLLEAYAGRRGFLGLHRLKTYGFMEIGFKAGRAATNGGFAAAASARPWDDLDDELEATRRARFAGQRLAPHRARRVAVRPTRPDGAGHAWQVTLDVARLGLAHREGDRLAVVPAATPALVERTLRSLRAAGGEPLPLTRDWRERLAGRLGEDPGASLPLAEFLRHARLRPLERRTGKALWTLTRCPSLRQVLESRREDQHELWDVLEMIGAETGYDVRRLWQARAWEGEALARLVEPERPRLYSISSAGLTGGAGAGTPGADGRVELTVGGLRFVSPAQPGGSPVGREGTGSTFLARPLRDPEEPVSVRVHRPSRFRLPADPGRPLVMFAGGTGVAPFMAFLERRAADPSAGPNVLFLSVRDPAGLHYEQRLSTWAASGLLELHVNFTRAAGRAGGASGRIDAVLADPEVAVPLVRRILPRRDGGAGASVYVCGQTAFAATVLGSLERLLTDATGDRARFLRLAGEGRLMLDVFTPAAPLAAPGVRGWRTVEASEVVLRNDDEHGRWLVIRGHVYDVDGFRDLHPGGARILDSGAGTDATRAYERAEHHLNPEVHSMLDMVKLGAVRRLDFRDVWGVALLGDGARDVTLHELYRSWVRRAYALVEQENAFANSVSVRQAPLTGGEAPRERTPMKTELLFEAHDRLVGDVLDVLLGEDLLALWAMTTGLCAPREGADRLRRDVDGVRANPRAAAARALTGRVAPLLDRSGDDERLGAALAGLADALVAGDRRLLRSLKLLLREGLLRFEADEHRTPERAGRELVGLLLEVPRLAGDWLDALAREVEGVQPPRP